MTVQSRALAIAGAAALSAAIAFAGTAKAETVIELAQTGCQLVETEDGVKHGSTPASAKDYMINLKPSDYLYSCPLNPTLDYKLVVQG